MIPTPAHIGILAHSADGAALAFLEMIREAARRLGPHEHPEITLSILPMAPTLDAYARGDLKSARDHLLRSASRLASTLRQRYGRDRVLVIVNRFDKHADINPVDIEKVVDSKVRHMIVSDYRLALQALNSGRPIALDNHNKLSAGIKSLAKDLAKIDSEPKKSESSGTIFGRLTGRG